MGQCKKKLQNLPVTLRFFNERFLGGRKSLHTSNSPHVHWTTALAMLFYVFSYLSFPKELGRQINISTLIEQLRLQSLIKGRFNEKSLVDCFICLLNEWIADLRCSLFVLMRSLNSIVLLFTKVGHLENPGSISMFMCLVLS